MTPRQRTRLCLAVRAVAIAAMGLLDATPVLAGGLLLYEVGTADVGLASAGYTARAQDASTVFTNPAGMTRLDGTQVVLGLLTTKQGARGLGLNAVKHAIQSMGGWVAVYSEPGVGSCFRMYMPSALPMRRTEERGSEQLAGDDAGATADLDRQTILAAVEVRRDQAPQRRR